MAFPEKFLYRDCPWCGTKSVAMRRLAKTTAVDAAQSETREWTWLCCPRCGGVVSVETAHDRGVQFAKELRVVPQDKTEVDVGHLPDEVERPYRNAIKVLEAGVPSSAAMELRRTLEAAAKAHGINDQPLVRAIEKLSEQGLVTKGFVQVLGHIKKIGNAGAHAGEQEVTEEEARTALKFTTQVLRNLFEIPAELARLDES